MYVEQSFGAETGTQEIHFRQAAAPSFQPQHQFSALILRAFEVQQDVDVTAGPGGGVLSAPDQVESFDPEVPRIKLSGDALRHAIAPAPVLVAGTSQVGHSG